MIFFFACIKVFLAGQVTKSVCFSLYVLMSVGFCSFRFAVTKVFFQSFWKIVYVGNLRLILVTEQTQLTYFNIGFDGVTQIQKRKTQMISMCTQLFISLQYKVRSVQTHLSLQLSIRSGGNVGALVARDPTPT